MKCNYCGNELREGAQFCGRCGRSAAGRDDEIVMQNKPDIGLIVLIGVLIIVMCGCAGTIIGLHNRHNAVYEYSSRVVHDQYNDSSDGSEEIDDETE